MNTYSRGHLFFVTSSGIIRYWNPLYKSESTSQVAIHTIKYLELYKNVDDVFLFYDNMCNLGKKLIFNFSIHSSIIYSIFKLFFLEVFLNCTF